MVKWGKEGEKVSIDNEAAVAIGMKNLMHSKQRMLSMLWARANPALVQKMRGEMRKQEKSADFKRPFSASIVLRRIKKTVLRKMPVLKSMVEQSLVALISEFFKRLVFH